MEWPHHESVTEYENPFFTVGYDRVERPDGERADYFWVDPPDAVAVVAHGDGEVVLVEQYRPRQRARTLECPSGAIDPGESPEAAAVRELEEETGYRTHETRRLASYRPSGWDRYTRHVVFATDLAPGEQSLDPGEAGLVVHRLPVAEAFDRAREAGAVGWLLTPLLVARDADLL
ncbi:NUDIX hydrolase [Halomarina litorea]|uniref:NUDIX hydrolase n=1 Tax=Halomarina litorea TaxID=2961595 RepID=UPI0020C2A938|nr:NUDIX hydrolase [Halomarina sp. BCD28]